MKEELSDIFEEMLDYSIINLLNVSFSILNENVIKSLETNEYLNKEELFEALFFVTSFLALKVNFSKLNWINQLDI